MSEPRVIGQVVGSDGKAPAPQQQTALGTKVTSTSWDNGDAIAITAGCRMLHVTVDQDMFLVCTDSDSAPSTDGAWYEPGTHEIVCSPGMTHLHYKSKTLAGNVWATAFHN
ncbi:MAG TPA: hypothetical protein VMY35_08355 [Phycisphaerae bacterium]|nr:hypothetical protein [Phycisphaerae bacterium]